MVKCNKSIQKEQSLEVLSNFDEKWGEKYPIITKSWMDNWTELVTDCPLFNSLEKKLPVLVTDSYLLLI